MVTDVFTITEADMLKASILPDDQVKVLIERIKNSTDSQLGITYNTDNEATLLENHLHALFIAEFFPDSTANSSGTPEDNAAKYFSRNIVKTHQTNGDNPSVAGIINDLFGLFGRNKSHDYVRVNMGFRSSPHADMETIERYLVNAGISKEDMVNVMKAIANSLS